MSEIELINHTLARAARLRRLQRGLRGLWLGLFIGACTWLLVLGLYKVLPLQLQLVHGCGLAAASFPLVGFLVGVLRGESPSSTARWVDLQEGLKERLSTAVEVTEKDSAGPWRDLIVADAARRAEDLRDKPLVRFRLPNLARWTVLLLAVAFGLGFVPEHRSQKYQQELTDAERIKEVGRHIDQLTKRQLAQRPPLHEPTREALEKVGELGQQFQRAKLTRGEALKGISTAQDRLKQELDAMGKRPGLRKLQKAARTRSSQSATAAASLQKQMEALKKQLGGTKADSQDMKDMQQKLDQLQRAARDLEAKGGGTDADRQQLAQSLSSLSAQAAELGMDLPNIDAAMQALAANQTDLFLQNLDAAMTDLEKLKQTAQAMKQLQAQMEKIGKDLAEQLENGQAQVAKKTLEKMIEQLKSSGLSQEQLQKIMNEVAQAIKPASPYGKVGEHLKQAAGQMGQGNKPGAAESLAAAAKELDDLMEQFNDAQSLMAAMEAMREASMCLASGQKWGLSQCSNCGGQGCAMCQGRGWGKGGRPGSGVGTWADEDSGWLYDGSWSELVDNSGITRPDMDPRGITDRGEGALNPNLDPTKVRGQFSPGGPMPSISLKGVSIKGASRIQFEEAASAAQEDAASALSQEKVPRAYQGPVKDYFDDLKE